MRTHRGSEQWYRGMVALLAVACLHGAAAHAAAGKGGRRPNVLFVAVDDLRPELDCYGASGMITPHFDRLAERGVRFDRAYCNIAVCGASRASLMKGLRPTPVRFTSFQTRADEDAPGAPSLPMLFKQHGYHTQSNGKVYHHVTDDPDAWSEPSWRPKTSSIWWALPENRALAAGGNRGPAYEAADVPETFYPDRQICDKTLDDLRRLVKQDKPFFMACGFYRPHLPFNVPKKYWDLYPAGRIRLPDNMFFPHDLPAAFHYHWGELRSYHGIPKQGPVPEETARQLIRGYLACVSFIDAQIGRLLDALEELGVADHTIIVLWGDHGWQLGEHGFWCKHTNFEVASRAPLLIAAPGIEGGRVTRRLVEFIDIYPTLCDLAGLPLPAHLEGKSMHPLLLDVAAEHKPAVFTRHGGGDAVRTDRYRYKEMRSRGGRGDVLGVGLFDLEKDPDENRNVAEDPHYAEVRGTLKAMLDAARAAKPVTGRALLEQAGVRGGLVLHLGSGDGTRTLALCGGAAFLVHGLDTEPSDVERARRLALERGLGGRVTFDRLNGPRLPLADHTVKLIVADRMLDVPRDEVLRVLIPGSEAFVAGEQGWTRVVKPRSDRIDEWTHYLYDATNNAVSRDQVVDQPAHLQWIGGPRWARSHDHLASVSAAVSAGGRLFTIADEGPAAAVALPARWRLIARDAFSGVLLWKRDIDLWEGHLRGFRSGPLELPRRLVAAGDCVYVTLGYGRPLCRLDAAGGETRHVYQGTEGTQEILLSDGTLYLVAGEQDLVETARRRGQAPPVEARRLLAVDADTGRIRWVKADRDTHDLLPVTPAVHRKRLFFQTPRHVIALNAENGMEVWRAERPVETRRPAWSTPTLVAHGGVVISADRAAPAGEREASEGLQWQVSSAGGNAPHGEMVALDASDGTLLWRAPAREAYNAPPDVLVAGGVIWSGNLVFARDPGFTVARDLTTGETRRRRPADQEFFTVGMGHHRCYRNKATERFLLLGRSGIELLDTQTGEATAHHYVRGVCQYGIFPANGLIYAPPHSCACFIQAKLNGFNALAPRTGYRVPRPSPEDARLEKGPAFGAPPALPPRSPGDDWPTYRRDAARSGSTPAAVPDSSAVVWHRRLDGRLTAPVAAEGKLLVAQRETHVVHALDAETGAPLWTFAAGGRLDSPPTVHRGRVLFGSADGYVYCLRAADGKLAWRFLAAPEDRRIVAYNQLESVWPVPGNVLVIEREGAGPQAWFAAGRTSYMDGGIFVYRLDLATGRMLSVTQLDNRDPETGLPPQRNVQGTSMPGALPDVLSCDGRSVFMRHTRFDLEGNVLPDNVPHLFSPAGFTDDSWWHRTYWIYGTVMQSGWSGWPRSGYVMPAGRLLVTDVDRVFGFGRLNQYANHGAHIGVPLDLIPWPPTDHRARGTTHYRLFASPKHPNLVAVNGAQAEAAKSKKPAGRRIEPTWSMVPPLTVRAMVLAGETLFLAGPPELLALSDGTTADQDLAAAAAAHEGRGGALLCAVASDSGRVQWRRQLDSPPVFDGLIAAGGRLYLVTVDGRIQCLGASRDGS